VLAWGVWAWAIVPALGTIAYFSEQLFDGEPLNGLLAPSL